MTAAPTTYLEVGANSISAASEANTTTFANLMDAIMAGRRHRAKPSDLTASLIKQKAPRL